jgi:hypothetical protein
LHEKIAFKFNLRRYNSHHMDIHTWSVGRTSRPDRVVAMAARGAAEAGPGPRGFTRHPPHVEPLFLD